MTSYVSCAARMMVAALAGLWVATRSAKADEIVKDGGFESAAAGGSAGVSYPFTNGQTLDGGNWVVSKGIVSVDVDTSFIFDDTRSVFLTRGTGTDSIKQTLATTAGESYTLSFYAASDGDNTFSVSWDGTKITGIPATLPMIEFGGGGPGSAAAQFTQYTAIVAATAATSTLEFDGQTSPPTTPPVSSLGPTIELDDVSVTSVPSPGSGMALLLGAGAFALLRARNTIIA